MIKVISGGQTGVDQAALKAARRLGIETGGLAPKGWRTEAGPAPWLADYGLIESHSGGYQWRTSQNVMAGDVTMVIGDVKSAGSDLTLRLAASFKKPRLAFSSLGPSFDAFKDENKAAAVVSWLQKWRPTVINVAGNRESVNLGVGEAAEEWLARILGEYRRLYNS